jgi:pimeloyl-ACP methyl ester carboxylesterase
MAMLRHLAGIRSGMVTTKRIRSHVLSSGEENGIPLVFIHGNLSAATYFEELMLEMPAEYRCIAPDLRGYGDTEDLPIDATRGTRDLADDLQSLLTALGIASAHLAGWSAGAGTIMQYALDHPARVDSLTLIAPVSPYGFGGTCDLHGTPSTSDFAGSGAGTINAGALEQMRLGNTSANSPLAPLQLLRHYFVHPGFHCEREEILVRATLKQKLGDRRYPGDYVPSPYWPHVAPGQWGPVNALSPKYYNTSGIVELARKPPILWVRGDADVVISDHSLFDPAAFLQAQAQSRDRPAAAAPIRPQPMVGQMRAVLNRYQRNGGRSREVLMEHTGHSPFLENRSVFLRIFTEFLAQCRASA